MINYGFTVIFTLYSSEYNVPSRTLPLSLCQTYKLLKTQIHYLIIPTVRQIMNYNRNIVSSFKYLICRHPNIP